MNVPIYYIKEAEISFGGKPLFSNLSFQILPQDKICLIGRNGCGKSTLLKIINEAMELDKGEEYRKPGLKIGYLPQTVSFEAEQNIYQFVLKEDKEEYRYLADQILEPLHLKGEKPMRLLSGGKVRRAALARALLGDPELILLDEPTNHLDIFSIEWLQNYINNFKGAVICISHDRAFLEAVTGKTFWLDRGKLRMNDKGYSDFIRWSEEIYKEEEKYINKLSQKLDEENLWRQQGVTARRKRNQRRLSELYVLRNKLREEKREQQKGSASIKLPLLTPEKAAKLVLEVEDLTHKFYDVDPPKLVIKDLSLRIIRKEKIGVMGRNGAGKSTFLKLLMGELEKQEGRIKFGPKIKISYFDQNRETLDPEKTLWETLCPTGGDTVKVGNSYRHVVAYLKDFLFTPDQAKAPVGSLSGGEANRLLLAKILANPGDLLILDEPSNDLDMDSLDMLTELLDDYPGTLLLVSHDRDFIEQIVTRTLFFEGNGNVIDFIGGYKDYTKFSAHKTSEKGISKERPAGEPAKKLSFKDKHALETLPGEIAELEKEIASIEVALADPDLFRQDTDKFKLLTEDLLNKKSQLAEKEDRWLEIELLRQKME